MYIPVRLKCKWVFLVRFNQIFVTASLTALLVGCAVGPDFKRPDAPDTKSYDSEALPAATGSADNESGAAQKFAMGADIPSEWWTLFHSEPLNKLIEEAIKANPDLAAAQASLRIAEENTLATDSLLFPTFTGDFNTTRQKTSRAANGGEFPGSLYTLHTASVSVSYGIDLWGASRRAIEEAKATEDYQRFQLEAAYLSLTGNVVVAAIQEASLRGQIKATEQILSDENKQLVISKQQLELGGIDKAPVLALEATMQQTRATLPLLEKNLSQTRHLLSALTGQLPSHMPEATFELSSLQLPSTLPVTLPSTLIEQRPDVRAAEANLHSASAAIGVAEAARLPQISLSADIGSQVNNLGKFFTPGSGIWAAGLDVSQTIFDAGNLEHKQGAAEATYDMAAADYRKTVLSSFQDVADTLKALQSDAEALKADVEAETAASDSLKFFQQQFGAGYASYLSVLTAEQTEQQTRLTLVQAEAQRYEDTTSLFQALGGGWWNRTRDITKNEAPEDQASAPTASHGDE